MVEVTGGVVLTSALGAFSDAVLHVRLLDVSHADAPAQVLAAVDITHVDYDAADDDVVPFTMSTPQRIPLDAVVVAAHLDRSGDGEVAVGDAVTTRAYPLRSPPSQVPLVVHLTPVGGSTNSTTSEPDPRRD